MLVGVTGGVLLGLGAGVLVGVGVGQQLLSNSSSTCVPHSPSCISIDLTQPPEQFDVITVP